VKPEQIQSSEKELQSAVIERAQARGWRVAHFRTVPVQHGSRIIYQTPVQADGAGFPDLCMVRDRVIWAELKSDTGRLEVAQQDWLFALSHADAECHLWWPRHWRDGTIEEVLR